MADGDGVVVLTRPELAAYLDTLEDPALRALCLDIDRRVLHHHDTGMEDFQVLADLLTAIQVRALAWKRNRL